MKRPIFVILLGLTLFTPAFATGHELWFEDSDGALVLYRGHGPGADDHGEANAPCPFSQYLRETVVGDNGAVLAFPTHEHIPAIWAPDARAVVVTVSNGCWSKTPRGTVNRPRTEVESPLTSWRSLESIKYIRMWDSALAQPLTADLEITPQSDPLTMQQGDKLKVLVTRQAEPVVGTVVTYNGKARGVTGPQGMINIRLKQSGRQSLAATVTTPLANDEEVDEIIATAFLEFFLESQ